VTMPGLTAEASFYRSTGTYHTVRAGRAATYEVSPQQMRARLVGSGVRYNPWCVRSCEIQCRWAGGQGVWCWYVCSWLCSGRAQVRPLLA
jgi:hypothetical protein